MAPFTGWHILTGLPIKHVSHLDFTFVAGRLTFITAYKSQPEKVAFP